LTLTYEQLQQQIESAGLAARGGFHVQPADGLGDARTLILIGFTRIQHWDTFARSPQYTDGRPDPLDRWSMQTINLLAEQIGGRALYPCDGPPFWPFQRWARRALALHISPLGVLLDPEFGLWHSYRGALALTVDVSLPTPTQWPNPCESCESKPCLHTCPVGAVQAGAYDVDSCRAQVRSTATGCRTVGCLARRACPVGSHNAYLPVQAGFHMRAFAPRDD
jgi:ferredoxin